MIKETFAKCKCPLWFLNQEKNGKKKRQRVETENITITQPLFSKTDSPTANPIYLQDSFSHSESENSGEEFSQCSSKRIHASNQTVSVQFPRKSKSKTLTQVADREGFSINHHFFVVASVIDASSGSINHGFFRDSRTVKSCFEYS